MAGVLKMMFVLFAMVATPVAAQEGATETEAAESGAARTAERAGDETVDALDDVVEKVNESEEAEAVKSSILGPIYRLAESFSFPAFHWLAFAAMVTGVVSFALQLVLGKLVVLSKFSLSPSEILADGLGLAVSLIGLVLTTQAATENSNFTESSAAVLSATGVGVLLGLLFYVWGQRQELQAVQGRRLTNAVQTAVVEEPRART